MPRRPLRGRQRPSPRPRCATHDAGAQPGPSRAAIGSEMPPSSLLTPRRSLSALATCRASRLGTGRSTAFLAAKARAGRSQSENIGPGSGAAARCRRARQASMKASLHQLPFSPTRASKIISNPPPVYEYARTFIYARTFPQYDEERSTSTLLLTQASRRSPGERLRSTFTYVDFSEEGRSVHFYEIFIFRDIFASFVI